MSMSTTVPLNITPEAAEHINRLGMRAEFERMIEFTRQQLSDLRGIDVELVPPYDTGDEDKVVIEVTRDAKFEPGPDPIWQGWCDWLFANLSPDVIRHFTRRVLYGGTHAG